MKAYQYNVKTGVYDDETSEEAAMLQYEDGLTAIPPPDYEHGQVPVFDRQKNEWTDPGQPVNCCISASRVPVRLNYELQ